MRYSHHASGTSGVTRARMEPIPPGESPQVPASLCKRLMIGHLTCGDSFLESPQKCGDLRGLRLGTGHHLPARDLSVGVAGDALDSYLAFSEPPPAARIERNAEALLERPFAVHPAGEVGWKRVP